MRAEDVQIGPLDALTCESLTCRSRSPMHTSFTIYACAHTSASQRCYNAYVNWMFNILQINGFRKNMGTIVCPCINLIGSASQIGSEKLARREEGSDK